jgi:hypothetical protein
MIIKREEEWDWPPTRRWRFQYRPTIEHQPSGWSSPVTKKVIDIYFRATIFIIKMLISIPLAIMAVGSIWLLWVIITLLRK